MKIKIIFMIIVAGLFFFNHISGAAAGPQEDEIAIEASEVETKTAEEYYTEGHASYKKGDYESAKKSYLNAEILSPGDAVIKYNLGITYYYLGESFSALEKMNVAVSLDPKMVDAHYSLGILNINTNKKDAAKENFKKGCDLGHKNSCLAYENF